MPQQINLYSPILLAPKRYFSARAMVQALAVLAAGLVGLSLWSVSQTQGLRTNLAAASAAGNAEQQRLQVALAARPAVPTDISALEQELAQARRQLADREALLASITTPASGHGSSRSALLRLLAQTLPASAWLTEVKLVDGRIELAGATAQPEALRPWLDRLAAHPALAGQTLQAVQVDRRDPQAGGVGQGESWSFRVISANGSANGSANSGSNNAHAHASSPPTDAGARP